MKTAILLLLLSSSAYAQVVVGGNVRAQADLYPGVPDWPSDNELWLWVSSTPTESNCDCWGYVGFNHAGGVISSDRSLNVSAYSVQYGELFMGSGQPIINVHGSLDTYPVSVGDDFYIGLRMVGPFQREALGWAHLRDHNGTLLMVGSAMAYGSGIVVGLVPEPSTLILVALMAAAGRIRGVDRVSGCER